MPRAVVTFRWVPTVNNRPHLEYGLWRTKAEAVQAAQEIILVRGPYARSGAAKVYYKIEGWQTHVETE